nr:MAG TPA_asm: hypothetical protein [Caudoviricetes sp.]
MGEEHLQELGRNSKVQQGSRDQLKAPSRRSSPRAKKKRPARRRKHKQDATTKGVVDSIPRPAEKGKGFHL